MTAAKRLPLAKTLAFVLLGLIVIITTDLALDGPYVSWFNRHHESLATTTGLIGKNEDEIVRLFGTPSRIDEAPRAYVYYPYPFVPVSQVKVFVDAGKVSGVKVFDD